MRGSFCSNFSYKNFIDCIHSCKGSTEEWPIFGLHAVLYETRLSSMNSQDQLVFRRILEGDEAAIMEAYHSCKQYCLDLLRRNFTYPAEIAMELYNDAFVEMWLNTLSGKLEELTNSLGAYVAGIVTNMAQDRIRKEKRQAEIREKMAYHLPSAENPSSELEDAQERQRIQAMLNRLGDRCQQLLVMHFFLHFDDHVISEDLGIPYDRVRKERYKCLAKARTEMNQIDLL
jgi:RNA polymerase sigma factor (sigma-70 family)